MSHLIPFQSANNGWGVHCPDCGQWHPIPKDLDHPQLGPMVYRARHPFKSKSQAQKYADDLGFVDHGCPAATAPTLFDSQPVADGKQAEQEVA